MQMAAGEKNLETGQWYANARSSLLFLHQTLSISPRGEKQSVITGNVKYPWSKFNFMIARVADFGVYKTSIAIHFIPQDTRSRVYLYVRAIFLSLFFLFLQPRNPRNQIELSSTEFTNDVGTITFLFICRHFFGGGKRMEICIYLKVVSTMLILTVSKFACLKSGKRLIWIILNCVDNFPIKYLIFQIVFLGSIMKLINCQSYHKFFIFVQYFVKLVLVL